MKHKIRTIKESSKPAIALIACLHGDEKLGKIVFQQLRKLKLKKGLVSFIVAHPQALEKKKRFLDQDLNRSFPGNKNGSIEEKIAHQLSKILRDYDLVLDIHATNSNFNSLAIVTKFDKKTKQILRLTPIDKIGLIRKKVFGGKEMIAHCQVGVSLEYGPDKTGKNYKLPLAHIKTLFKNLDIISGEKNVFSRKTLFKVSGTYKVPKNFEPNKKLNEFRLIKKGQVIGSINKKIVKARRGFYPLFLGKGRYKKTLALMAGKKK